MTEIVGREHRVRLKAFGIADGIDAEFEILRWQAISTAQPFRLRGHIVLSERQLRFGSNDARDVDIHPMEGLIRFGPYSHGKLSSVANPIRVGMIVAAGANPPNA
jgi:hypothetical protein